jgi:RNA polymerase sigma factor (sigma-70 family)
MSSYPDQPYCSATILTAPQQKKAAAAGIAAGDDHARFRSVVLPHLDDAYRLACWLTGSRTDSEDVVQDACLRALRAIGGFSNGNARAWLLTIVRHSAYDWMRKNRPGSVALIEDLEAVERAPAGEPDLDTPERALIAQDDATQLESAIAALPAAFREALVLREVQGLTYCEIAEVTGVPTGTVMSRLARARRRLVAIMAKNMEPVTIDSRAPAQWTSPQRYLSQPGRGSRTGFRHAGAFLERNKSAGVTAERSLGSRWGQ